MDTLKFLNLDEDNYSTERINTFNEFKSMFSFILSEMKDDLLLFLQYFGISGAMRKLMDDSKETTTLQILKQIEQVLNAFANHLADGKPLEKKKKITYDLKGATNVWKDFKTNLDLIPEFQQRFQQFSKDTKAMKFSQIWLSNDQSGDFLILEWADHYCDMMFQPKIPIINAEYGQKLFERDMENVNNLEKRKIEPKCNFVYQQLQTLERLMEFILTKAQVQHEHTDPVDLY